MLFNGWILFQKKNVTSFPQAVSIGNSFVLYVLLYDHFICQFGFMEPIKQTVENDLDSLSILQRAFAPLSEELY